MNGQRRDETERRGGEDGRQVWYERGANEPPSVAMATALAAYNGDDVTETSTRLYDYIDPEALDALFADRDDDRTRDGGRVHFDIDGTTVVVRPSGVQVYEGR